MRQQHVVASLQRGAGSGRQAHLREHAAQGQAPGPEFIEQGLQAGFEEAVVLGFEQHVFTPHRRKIQLPTGTVRGVRAAWRTVVLQEDHRHPSLAGTAKQASDALLQGQVARHRIGALHEGALHIHQQQGVGLGNIHRQLSCSRTNAEHSAMPYPSADHPNALEGL